MRSQMRNRSLLLGPMLLAVTMTISDVNALPGRAQTGNPLAAAERLITLSATGEVTAKPDTAFINSGVTTTARKADEALAQNSQAMNRIVDALIELGLDEHDIKTVNFSISPQQKYYSDGRTPLITGYRVYNAARIRVRRIADISKILDQIVKLGSNQVTGIKFSVDDKDALLDEARRRAIREARRRAQLYAKAAGVKLGRVMAITEQGARLPTPRPMMARQMRPSARSAPPIQPGTQKWSVTVSVSFSLE